MNIGRGILTAVLFCVGMLLFDLISGFSIDIRLTLAMALIVGIGSTVTDKKEE